MLASLVALRAPFWGRGKGYGDVHQMEKSAKAVSDNKSGVVSEALAGASDDMRLLAVSVVCSFYGVEAAGNSPTEVATAALGPKEKKDTIKAAAAVALCDEDGTEYRGWGTPLSDDLAKLVLNLLPQAGAKHALRYAALHGLKWILMTMKARNVVKDLIASKPEILSVFTDDNSWLLREEAIFGRSSDELLVQHEALKSLLTYCFAD